VQFNHHPCINRLLTKSLLTNSKSKIMKTLVKRTDYTLRPVGTLDTPAIKVHTNLYLNNTMFVTPPFTDMIFGGLITNYTAKFNAYKDGGATAHSQFMTAEAALLEAMNDTAYYVDSVALGDRAIVIASGFEPTKETQTPKAKPEPITGLELIQDGTGTFKSSCDPQDGVDVYVAIISPVYPLPTAITVVNGKISLLSNDGATKLEGTTEDPSEGAIIDFSKSRKKTFEGLTPNVRYYITYFGISSGGVGQLCAPVSLVCN
jgi:hypothetical protein